MLDSGSMCASVCNLFDISSGSLKGGLLALLLRR
jgi:hypothetical protein